MDLRECFFATAAAELGSSVVWWPSWRPCASAGMASEPPDDIGSTKRAKSSTFSSSSSAALLFQPSIDDEVAVAPATRIDLSFDAEEAPPSFAGGHGAGFGIWSRRPPEATNYMHDSSNNRVDSFKGSGKGRFRQSVRQSVSQW